VGSSVAAPFLQSLTTHAHPGNGFFCLLPPWKKQRTTWGEGRRGNRPWERREKRGSAMAVSTPGQGLGWPGRGRPPRAPRWQAFRPPRWATKQGLGGLEPRVGPGRASRPAATRRSYWRGGRESRPGATEPVRACRGLRSAGGKAGHGCWKERDGAGHSGTELQQRRCGQVALARRPIQPGPMLRTQGEGRDERTPEIGMGTSSTFCTR
jgi:hypothetical protein